MKYVYEFLTMLFGTPAHPPHLKQRERFHVVCVLLHSGLDPVLVYDVVRHGLRDDSACRNVQMLIKQYITNKGFVHKARGCKYLNLQTGTYGPFNCYPSLMHGQPMAHHRPLLANSYDWDRMLMKRQRERQREERPQ